MRSANPYATNANCSDENLHPLWTLRILLGPFPPFKGCSFDGGLCSSADADFVTKGGIFWQNESVLGYI